MTPDSSTRAQKGSKRGSPGDFKPSSVRTGPVPTRTTRASRSSTHSSSATALSTSESTMYGVAKIRSSYAKPQSSSIHRLNARNAAWAAGRSSLSACSIPTASVGKNSAPSVLRLSMVFKRISRSRYAGSHGRSSPNRSLTLSPFGLRPRKYCSRLPGAESMSNVGFGMKRLIFPPTSNIWRPFTSAHCIQRRLNSGSM